MDGIYGKGAHYYEKSKKAVYPKNLRLICIYLAGLSCTCIGVVMMLESKMGIDAWNSVFVGLEDLTPISFGMWSIIIQGSFWAIASLLRHRAEMFCVIPIIWKGIILDAVKMAASFLTFGDDMWIRNLLFFVGYGIVGVATGIYVATGYPKMPIDDLMTAISDFFSLDLKYARFLIEFTGMLMMILVGGSYGIGTIIITVSMGSIVSFARKFAENKIINI